MDPHHQDGGEDVVGVKKCYSRGKLGAKKCSKYIVLSAKKVYLCYVIMCKKMCLYNGKTCISRYYKMVEK